MLKEGNVSVRSMASFAQDRVAANSLTGVLRFLILGLVYVLIYPFLLRSLGPAQFGLWALLCLPSQYVALSGFGLSGALTKLVAESPFEGGRERLERLAASATISFMVVGSAITLGVWYWDREILHWLNIRPELFSNARVLLLGTAGIIWVSLLTDVYTSVLSGLHRMDLANATQIVSSCLNAAGMFVAIKLQGGLIGLMLSNAASVFITWLIALLLARRIARVTWRVLPCANWEAFSSLLRFGFFLYIAGVSSLLLEPTMKVLLSRYGSLELVSSFELASKAVLQVRSLFVNLMLPLLPAASLLMHDSGAIRALFARSMRLLWLAAIPVFLTLASLSAPLVHLWLGATTPLVQAAIALLALGWLINVLTLPAFILVQGMNLPRYAMFCALLQGIISLAGGYILIPRFGFYGAVYSEVAALVLAGGYIFFTFVKVCPMRVSDVFGSSPVRAIGIPAGLAVVLLALRNLLHVASSWRLVAPVLVCSVLYASLLYRKTSSGFTARELIGEWLPRALRRGKFVPAPATGSATGDHTSA